MARSIHQSGELLTRDRRNLVKLAGEVFVRDYLMVVENDQEAWDDLIQMTRVYKGSVASISDVIQYDYETMVTNVISQIEESQPAAAVNLLKQILLGWGASEFDAIAKYAIEADKEVA
jgi:hypothetical protein